jgi:crossover junction endodeoxyribonuclease RuvC
LKPPLSENRARDRESARAGDTNLITSRSLAPSLPHQVVLGVDPGLATTGWGVVEKKSGDPTLKAFGAILTSAHLSLTERLLQIHTALTKILEAHTPSVLAIEELYFAKFAVSIAATAQARGVILLCAAERNVPVVEYNPRAVKMAMTGFGSASKFQIQSMVQRQFSLKELPRPDDAADALAIALCHIQTRRELVSA